MSFLCRAHVPEGIENIATVIDPTYPVTTPTLSTASATQLPAHLEYAAPEHSSSPVPPYMPIQGTRRTNLVSQPDKKKKSKDKCTHQ